MGAGSSAAGVGLAGFDVPFIPGQTTPFLPRAMFFDPSIKQFLSVDLNGNPIDMHPIDQIVTVRACTAQGQSKSDKTLGQRLGIICARQPATKVPQLARVEVQRLYQDLITAGDITLIDVATDNSLRGRNLFKITYENNRDPATNPRFPGSNSKQLSVVGVNE